MIRNQYNIVKGVGVMKQLNDLVIEYQKTKDESIFNQIYEIVSEKWVNLHFIGKSLLSDEHEATALYEDTLIRCIERFNGTGDFMNYYKAGLRKSRANLFNKYRRRFKVIVPMEENIDKSDDSDDSIAATIENVPDLYTTEELALQKTEADQRQLIDFLLSGADATTTAIVEAFLAHPKPTPTAIGKALGLHHSVVKRKLERLATKFDAKQFGDYRDYLAVAR
jgi:DNA-directed RNA polymerase specialized sigma24 family protein